MFTNDRLIESAETRESVVFTSSCFQKNVLLFSYFFYYYYLNYIGGRICWNKLLFLLLFYCVPAYGDGKRIGFFLCSVIEFYAFRPVWDRSGGSGFEPEMVIFNFWNNFNFNFLNNLILISICSWPIAYINEIKKELWNMRFPRFKTVTGTISHFFGTAEPAHVHHHYSNLYIFLKASSQC